MTGLEYRLAVGRRFGERLALGDCVTQLGADSFAGIPCTVSDGQVKTLSHVNALVAMQVMKDRGLQDPRFFSLAQIESAGWKLGQNASGIGMQYLATTAGDAAAGESRFQRFQVFHASDVDGCGPWVRNEPVGREDLVQALAETDINVVGQDHDTVGAIAAWVRNEFGAAGATDALDAALGTALVATWLEAETGLQGLRDEMSHKAAQQTWAETVKADPLRLYAVVGNAERCAATLMSQARTVQFERKAVEAVQAQAEQAGVGMLNEKRAGKVSARVEQLFAERQAVLAVPFKEKDRAQALGAIYHPDIRVWFVPPKVELAAFKEWNSSENGLGPTASRQMQIDEFMGAMKDMGLEIPQEIIADSKWHNVVAKSQKKNKAGSYLLNLEGGRDGVPCGSIANRLSGERLAWRYDGPLLTPEQRARMREEARVREWAAAREEKVRQDLAAVHAAEIWSDALPGDGHGYVLKKGIAADGLRQISGARLLQFDEFIGESGRSAIRPNEMYALVPLMTAEGELRSLQAISPDGQVKTFMRGAQKSGLMFVLGNASFAGLITGECAAMAYAEGMATSASFRAGSGVPVVVCFDAGNMETVIEATAPKLAPGTIKLLAVDNDQFHVERALAVLAKTVGVNAYAKEGDTMKVQSRAGCSGLTGGAFRSIAIGDVVANGQWQQGPKGTYCVSVEHEADGVAVRSLKVEMVPTNGQKTTQMFANRGAEVGRVSVGHAENSVVVSPWFDSLDGRPTDWNDLMMREGSDVMQERVMDQVSQDAFNFSMKVLRKNAIAEPRRGIAVGAER